MSMQTRRSAVRVFAAVAAAGCVVAAMGSLGCKSGSTTTPEGVTAAKEDSAKLNMQLYNAANGGHRKEAQKLLNKGADPNAVMGPKGWTSLLAAAHNGHSEVVEVLLQNGANPNVKDEDGNTPLHFATFYGHDKAAKHLRAHGADRTARNNAGKIADPKMEGK